MNDTTKPLKGKEGFMKGTGMFYGCVDEVKIQQQIIQDQNAAVISNYKIRSPKGKVFLLIVPNSSLLMKMAN
ncbi:MAG: hypothetical protein QM571_02515 [Micrococcaceae bacterium]